MPLPMVHLSVAKNILDAGFKTANPAGFYLGAISPDAIHMRENADKAAKNQTHLSPDDKKRGAVDEREYLGLLKGFIAENKDRTDESFLLGYCTHIATDFIWIKEIFNPFARKYAAETSPAQDRPAAYYNDTDIIDQFLYNESEWRAAVWEELKHAEAFGFLNLLSAHEISAWRERTLHWYDSGESGHKNPIRYITKADVEGFIPKCAEMILDELFYAYVNLR